MRGRYCVSFAVLDAINNLRPQGTSVQQFNKCICDMNGTRYVVMSRAKGSTRAARSAFDKPHDEQARKLNRAREQVVLFGFVRLLATGLCIQNVKLHRQQCRDRFCGQRLL